MGSADSSSDELCFCGHKRSEHWEEDDESYTGCTAAVGPNGEQDDCTRFRLSPPLGGMTVEPGPEKGDVCTGPDKFGAWKGHQPVVRGEKGRCFICEPVTVPEAIDMAEDMEPQDDGMPEEMCGLNCQGDGCPTCAEPMEPVSTGYCDECGCSMERHGPEMGCIECTCRVGEAVQAPAEELPYLVTYAVHGGQEYSLLLPHGVNVAMVDGQLRLWHPGRPALGIVGITT